MKTYRELARMCGAYHRCVASGNTEWEAKWKEQINAIVENFPSGSGFDSGTELDLDASNDEKLTFTTSFHHMNDDGMYDGWTEHVVIVTPSLGLDYHLKISGRDRNGIKEYISECFCTCLDAEPKELTAETV
jgi:hypothetical protein